MKNFRRIISRVSRGSFYKIGGMFVLAVLAISAVWLGNNLRDQTPLKSFAAGETVNIYFSPSSLTFPNQIPENGTTQLMLDAKTNKIAAVNIEIDFDYTKVKLANEVIVGTALPNLLPGNTTMAQANASGKLIIHLGKTPGSTNDPTGTFSVATIIWASATTQTNQTTQVTVNTATSQVTDNSDPANPKYVPITATPLTVIINPAASATPRPTNTPTPRPTNTPTPRPTLTSTPTPRPTNTPTPRPTLTSTPTPISTNTPTPLLTNTSTPPPPTSITISPKPTPGQQIMTFTAIEDRTVRYGQKKLALPVSLLRVGGARWTNNFLIKFNVTGLSGLRIVSAKLRLFSRTYALTGGSFYTTTNNWSEETVMWDTAPAAFTYLDKLGFILPSRWYEVDVKEFVTGDGTYSFRATSSSWKTAAYSSSESKRPPQLVISYE